MEISMKNVQPKQAASKGKHWKNSKFWTKCGLCFDKDGNPKASFSIHGNNVVIATCNLQEPTCKTAKKMESVAGKSKHCNKFNKIEIANKDEIKEIWRFVGDVKRMQTEVKKAHLHETPEVIEQTKNKVLENLRQMQMMPMTETIAR